MECMRKKFIQGVLLDGRYKTVCPLNHGSFGLVFKALDMHTGEFVALKCVPKSTSLVGHATVNLDARSELPIHSHIGQHPGIVNLLHNFETEHHIYLVLEYCQHGDLYESIRAGTGPKGTEKVREAILQLIDAVDYMHSRGVYHRDIKPENIFIAEDRSFKLGDFGLATKDALSSEIAVGSDRYMAPEQLDPALAPITGFYEAAKADIWAIGICILNILFSRNPFSPPSFADPLYKDFAADRQSLFDIFPSMSQDTFEILIHCLAINPEKRSLTLARAAARKAIYFSTDDEAFDEIEAAAETVVTTANREPLRTPSITSPQLDAVTGAFPWAKSLAATQPFSSLSAIVDEDDLFSLRQGWQAPSTTAYDDSSIASFMSFVDSGLGASIKSSQFGSSDIKRSEPLPINGSKSLGSMAMSVPNANVTRSLPFQSKSWSEIFTDDDDDEAESETDFSIIDHGSISFESAEHLQLSSIDSTGSGTPRPALAELTATPNSRVETPVKQDKDDDHTLFEMDIHEDQEGQEVTPIKVSSNSVTGLSRLFSPYKRKALDKWAELGDKRRQFQTPVKRYNAESHKEMVAPNTSSPASIAWRQQLHDAAATNNSLAQYQPKGFKAGSNWNFWSKASSTHQALDFPPPVMMKKEWNMSQDWRKRIYQPAMTGDHLVF